MGLLNMRSYCGCPTLSASWGLGAHSYREKCMWSLRAHPRTSTPGKPSPAQHPGLVCGRLCLGLSKGIGPGRDRDRAPGPSLVFLCCWGLVPLGSFCFSASLLARFLSLKGPCCVMGSPCTLFICSLCFRWRSFYIFRDPAWMTLHFCDDLCAGQHCLVRDMFLFLMLSHVVVSLC